jgi:hypothetical protein
VASKLASLDTVEQKTEIKDEKKAVESADKSDIKSEPAEKQPEGTFHSLHIITSVIRTATDWLFWKNNWLFCKSKKLLHLYIYMYVIQTKTYLRSIYRLNVNL